MNDDKKIFVFNYNDYLKNPVAEFCVAQLPNPTILTLDDLMPDIMKLHHAKETYENLYKNKNGKSLPSFLGDQIRLYYSLQYDNYLYCDADVYMTKEMQETIWANKNCVYYGKKFHEINNGTFFCSDRGCKFNEYYFNLYETKDLKDMSNVNIYFKYPYHLDFEKEKAGDMNLLNIPVKHFILSKMWHFKQCYDQSPKDDTIYYTNKSDFCLQFINHPLVWQIGKCAEPIIIAYKHITNNKVNVKAFQWNIVEYEYIPQDVQFDLWKEQVKYTLQNPHLKFEEV